jgi:hypothetical protein
MRLRNTAWPIVFLTAIAVATAPLQAQEAESKPEQEPEIFSPEDYAANSRRAADRDYFPVVYDPTLANVAAGNEALSPDEPVIGLRIGKVAHAYPISVMGGVELVNDTIGELPVAVSW